jgi:hypothetical protein
MNGINFQTLMGQFSAIITILTAIIAFIKLVMKKQSNNPKHHSSKGTASYILLPVFLIISGTMICLWYYGVEISVWLYVAFVISLVSILWMATIASLSFNKKEIMQPAWIWKLLFYKIPKFGTNSKLKINILLLCANDYENQAKEIINHNEENALLDIQIFNCSDKSQQGLTDYLRQHNFWGIYILLSPELEENEWYYESCKNWTSNNKTKPVIYTNFNTTSNLSFGKVPSQNYKYGILKLFERTCKQADEWEKQAKNHRIVCFSTLLLIITVVIFGKIDRDRIMDAKTEFEQKYTILKREFERYDNNYDDSNDDRDLLYKANEFKKSLGQNIGDSTSQKKAKEYFKCYAENVVKKILRANGISDKKLESCITLSYYKFKNDTVVEVVISGKNNVAEKKFPIGESIISGAYTQPNEFVLYRKNGQPEKMGWKINVADNAEIINEELSGVSFIKRFDWKELVAILVYWLHDNKGDGGIGLCVEIKTRPETPISIDDISFLEERITRAVLRESLKEINLFPQELFFESNKNKLQEN